MLDQIGSSHPKCFQLGAVQPALNPLMYGLPGHGRVDTPSRFLDTVVIARRTIATPPFCAGSSNAKARQCITEVHVCQLYHTFFKPAMVIASISGQYASIREKIHNDCCFQCCSQANYSDSGHGKATHLTVALYKGDRYWSVLTSRSRVVNTLPEHTGMDFRRP